MAIIKKYLTFTDASNINGKPYDDERKEYIGKSGLFMTVLSNARPGMIKGVFHVVDANGQIASIKTSSGEIKENDECIFLKTGHSMYVFKKTYELTQEEENILFNYANKDKTQQENKEKTQENKEKIQETKAKLNDNNAAELDNDESKDVFAELDKIEKKKEETEKKKPVNKLDDDDARDFEDLMMLLDDDEDF